MGFAGGGSVFAGLGFLGLVSSGRAFCLSPPGCLVGCVLPVPPLGVAWFLGLYGLPPPGWGAVNRLGVISFSIYGFGLLYFLVILYLFG